MVRYVTSLYWSITTLTTTGYGDLHAVSEREMIFTMFYMMFDLGLTSYLIGNMTNLVVHATSRTRAFVSKALYYYLQIVDSTDSPLKSSPIIIDRVYCSSEALFVSVWGAELSFRF